MYKPNSFLSKAIESQDIFGVRGALTGMISVDPAFKTNEFAKAVNYVESSGINVFETEHNESFPMNMDSKTWDRHYFASTVTYLQANFTKARLEHTKEVGRHVYGASSSQRALSTATEQKATPNHATSASKTPNPSSARDDQPPRSIGANTEPKKESSHLGIVLAAAAGIALVALVGVLVLK